MPGWQRQAGEFDRKIRIEQKTVTQDSAGTGYGDEEITVWNLFAEAWARRRVQRVMSTRDRTFGLQLEARIMLEYELRHPISGLTDEMRVVDRALTYEIDGILPPERQFGHQTLYCYLQGT